MNNWNDLNILQYMLYQNANGCNECTDSSYLKKGFVNISYYDEFHRGAYLMNYNFVVRTCLNGGDGGQSSGV